MAVSKPFPTSIPYPFLEPINTEFVAKISIIIIRFLVLDITSLLSLLLPMYRAGSEKVSCLDEVGKNFPSFKNDEDARVLVFVNVKRVN